MLEVAETGFAGLLLIKPKVHGDARGYFLESYNAREYKKIGVTCDFVQDNESFSKYGTLRGLHFQTGEHAQTKLVRVVSGKILDVVVDLRPDEKTFGRTFSVELTADNKLQLLVPAGFAHGFVVLSEAATVVYKCDRYYAPEFEAGIHYADKDLAIDWRVPAEQLIISDKDKKHPGWREVMSNEKLIGHRR